MFQSIQDSIRQAKRVAYELHGYAIAAAPSHSNRESQFIIVSGGRRGSHLLIDLMNSHPEIHSDSELLHPGRIRERMFSPQIYLRGHRGKRPESICGFKASVYHLQRQGLEPETYLSNFYSSGGRIIYLRRKNLARSAISAMIAHIRGKHHDSVPDALRNDTFTIDRDELMYRLDRRRQTDQDELQMFSQIPHLALTYEQDLLPPDSHQQTANQVFDTLGCKSVPVATRLARTSPTELADIVRNFDDVRQCLEGTEFASMLSQPETQCHAA